DEVQVGVGRTGKLWGYEHLGIEPDVFTVAKGLGGGIPIGAMLCKASCDVLRPGDHASTFGGNPFACGVALAVCQTVDTENLIANAEARGQQLRQGMQQLVNTYPQLFEQVRGWGLINGLVLKADAPLKSIDIVKAAMPQGLLLVPAGPSVVRFVPPLVVSVTDIDEALEKLSTAVSSLG
ncbi:MAG: aminotransferase class III-fold pyridoxal phosphate-dependent enzyme, partial [Cyanobacteria bacterium P01_A01_bin.105]